MKRIDCNSQFGFVRPRLIAVIGVGLVIAVWLGIRWQPERVLERQQAAFISALEKGSARKLRPLLAENYRDQWNFSREDAAVALNDVGTQFILLTAEPIDSKTELGDGRATVTTEFQFSGSGSPIAHEVMRRTNQLKEPFVFTWEKQSFWPWNWQLTRIENPELPEDLHSYEPGDISRRMSVGGEF